MPASAEPDSPRLKYRSLWTRSCRVECLWLRKAFSYPICLRRDRNHPIASRTLGTGRHRDSFALWNSSSFWLFQYHSLWWYTFWSGWLSCVDACWISPCGSSFESYSSLRSTKCLAPWITFPELSWTFQTALLSYGTICFSLGKCCYSNSTSFPKIR